MTVRPVLGRGIHPRAFPRAVVSLALVVAVVSGTLTEQEHVEASQGAYELLPVAAVAPGDSRAEPAPLGEPVTAGPWRMTVLEVITGQDATDRVTGANPLNDPPRDGFTYVLIHVAAENTSNRPLRLDTDDFALVGASGLVRRFVGALPPDPAVDRVVDPGAAHEGWVVLGAPVNETSLVLLYDSVTLPGSWADRAFALGPDAAVLAAAQPVEAPNEAGTDPGSPVGISGSVVTLDWRVELLEVVQGDPVYDLYNGNFRVQALDRSDASDAAPWLALRIQVTNVRPGVTPAFLPPTAFMLVDSDGNAVPNTLTLTAANPDASGSYAPGASR
ncbi:MAG: DUF4352 domain-containing protein, partial [Chloroflexota bacterium]|nr:DUF4352 domain-containing protein [Chloroflexota bacterium]